MREFIGPVPQRISRLPRDKRGFPVPFFVKWIDGEPHFPIMDPERFVDAVRHHRCWICGGTLGGFKSFCIGPMCVVNRVTAEPPSHLECAKFAVLNCPFMANPKVGRGLSNAEAEAMGAKVAGIMIERNPGVAAIWTTRSYKLEHVGNGHLFRLGPATSLSFWAHGRAATKAEVDHSVGTGLPILEKVALNDGPTAFGDYKRQVASALKLIEEALAGGSLVT